MLLIWLQWFSSATHNRTLRIESEHMRDFGWLYFHAIAQGKISIPSVPLKIQGAAARTASFNVIDVVFP